jgi:hypothetical protein
MDETLENIGEYEGSGDLIPTRDTWGTEEPPEHTTPEVRLWRSVLQLALEDMRYQSERDKIKQWFMTDDYIQVCSLAGIDSDKFISHALNIPCTKLVLNL